MVRENDNKPQFTDFRINADSSTEQNTQRNLSKNDQIMKILLEICGTGK